MARETLPIALKLMFGHEGGYSNVATDSGGPTKYGVTHRTLAAHRGVASVTPSQVRDMTIEEATEIYRTGYWTQSGGDLLPKGLDYAAFDFGVNSGPSKAVKVLQELVGVTPDGNAGPMTLRAVENYPGGVLKLLRDYCEARMDFLRSIKNPKTGFPKNGRGWTIRVTGRDPEGKWADQPGVLGHALELASASHTNMPIPTPQTAPAGGDAKAVAPAPNPLAKPEVLLPGAAAVITAAAPLATGPVVWALAFAVVVLVLIGAFYAFRRIAKTPA